MSDLLHNLVVHVQIFFHFINLTSFIKNDLGKLEFRHRYLLRGHDLTMWILWNPTLFRVTSPQAGNKATKAFVHFHL